MTKTLSAIDAALLKEGAKRALEERAALRTEAHKLTKEIKRLFAARYRVDDGPRNPPYTGEIDNLKAQRLKVWERINYLSKVITKARQAQRYTKHNTNAAQPAPHIQAKPEYQTADLLSPEGEALLDEVLG